MTGLMAMVLLLATSVLAEASVWTLQAGRLDIAARYEGQPVPARIGRFDVVFDPAPSTARLQVDIDVASVDFDSADINEAVRAAEWFDVARYPRARFVSQRIEPVESRSEGEYMAHGVLELKGVQRPVSVPLRWRVEAGRGHLQGELQLRRTDFNIGTGEWASADEIGHEVDVRFDLILRPAGEDRQ